MAETLIIILAEHNVTINFADHFTKLVSNKLVFPDSVFLCVHAVRAPCSLKVVIAHIVTNFFSRNLTGLIISSGAKSIMIISIVQEQKHHDYIISSASSYRSFIQILYSEQPRESLLIRTNLSVQSALWLSKGRFSSVTTWHLTPNEVKINKF